MTRFDLDMDGSMEPSEQGTWVRYEDAQRKPLTDEMEIQLKRHLGPHRRSAFRDGWRSAELAHGITGEQK